MSGTGCKYCGCQIVEKDAARGDTVCTNCGAVLEENAIVSEVQFQETGSGGHSVIGQFVNPDMPTKLNIGGRNTVSDSRQSREVLLQNARRQILEVSGQLKLNQHCVDMALNFYKMALARNLTRGRRKTHVIAACLYITCRLEGTAHFLLDFSDALQVNVFELGRVYNFLARNLYITLPPNDPCVYVMRFANSLEFGDKEHEVSMVALRLVQRMKRDWMSIGRRPTGLCGAALLLAARFHNFNRTISDIIRVVNISEQVIRRRLEEFSVTPTSSLTLDDFQTVDLEEECDPPAYNDAKNKASEN
uniref:B-related factor 1 n=1 Tax=Romanomermis culicivorax TaxID=13658 RepID=A0A915IJN0_ROMCU